MYMPEKKGISTGQAILIGVIVGLAAYTLWLYKIQPVYTIINPIVAAVKTAQQTFLPTVSDYVQKNPLTVLTAAVSIGGVVGGKLLQLHYEKQKAQIAAEAQRAIEDNMKLSQAYAQLQQQNQTLQQQVQQLQSQDYQKLLAESQGIIAQKAEEIKKLQAQIQALQNMLLLKDTQVVEKTVVK